MPRPDFFIVGAPKSGTTALYHYLKTHPCVFLPEIKEPCHFASDLQGDYGRVETPEDYAALYAPVADRPDVLAGDASPVYMLSDVAIPEIMKFNPAAKIIAIVRNPLEMALSIHNQALKVPEEDVADFETAWRLQESRARGLDIPKVNRRPVNLQYARVCALGTQVQRLMEIVPEKQRLILVQEDMKRDPAAVYARVLDFLGLPHDGRSEFPAHNQRADLRSRRLQIFMKNPPRLLWPLRRLFHSVGFRPLRIMAALNRRPARAQTLRPEFRDELTASFEQEIALLEKLLQRDFSHWRTSRTDKAA
jgi:hypothetical protein